MKKIEIFGKEAEDITEQDESFELKNIVMTTTTTKHHWMNSITEWRWLEKLSVNWKTYPNELSNLKANSN